MLGEPLRSLGCAIDAKHLLVSNGKTSAISEVLGRSNTKVGTNCPVKAKKNSHNCKDGNVVKLWEAEEDKPKCSCCLLNLDVTSSKDCAKLSLLLKSNQNNVQNESEEQKKHDGGEGTTCDKLRSVRCLHACLYCVLAKVWVNDHCRKVEASLKSNKDWTECSYQAAGTNQENLITNDCLKEASEYVVPLLLKKNVADSNDQTDEIGWLSQEVARKPFPNTKNNIH